MLKMQSTLLLLGCLMTACTAESWTRHCLLQDNACIGKKAKPVCGLDASSGKYRVYNHLCQLHTKACVSASNIAIVEMAKCSDKKMKLLEETGRSKGQSIRNVFVRPGQQTVLEGTDVKIVCFAEYNGEIPKFRWEIKDDLKANPQSGDISGGTNGVVTSTLKLDNIGIGKRGTYICTAYDSEGNSQFAEATVDVQYRPKATVRPTYLSVNQGEKASFTCVATGNPLPRVVWMKGNTLVSRRSELIISSAQLTDHGEYRCLASNSISDVSAVAHLNVKVDGGWSYGGCTVCGRNPYNNNKCQKKCERTCNNPSPANGGKSCEGNDEYAVDCQKKDCKVPNKKKDCFPGDAVVPLASGGSVFMRDLKVGDEVLAVSDADEVAPSKVLTFLHREDDTKTAYKRIQTDQQIIRLSPKHLIFASERASADRAKDVFASKVRPGMYIKELNEGQVHFKRVLSVSNVTAAGKYAPLTEHGNIIVNNVMTSCYAYVNSHWLAHVGLTPLRWYYMYGGLTEADAPENGIHWYPTLLQPMLAVLPQS